MRRTRKGPAFLVIFIMLLIIAAYVYGAYQIVKPADHVICKGVFVDSINLSGMTRDEAIKAVRKYSDIQINRTLEVDVNGETVTIKLDKLGYQSEANDFVDQALQVGKGSNPFANYVQIREAAVHPLVFDLEFHCQEKKIQSFVKKVCAKKCTKVKNSKIKMESGVLVYTKDREGSSLNVGTTVERIQKEVKKQEDKDTIRVKADVKIQKPSVPKKLTERCKDKIGTFRTTYNAGNVSRSRNLANAARLINGHVINPGKTFSVHDAISPLTEENGYYAAPSYNNGEVVDSIGGGVCQVSTTLYNAVLRAELEVVERSPHSMVVNYVEPSMDAAIAGDYKDFKFKNNTDVPLFIEGGTEAGTIYFTIYGEETRSPQRKVTFKSETTETIQPGADKVTYDKTKPTSYRSVTQEAHIGYKAVLWKIVKENGKTKKTQVNASTYQAVPRYVVRGAAKAAPKQSPAPTGKPKESQKPAATKKPRETQKPKETVKPKPTQQAPAQDPNVPNSDQQAPQ